tara:strand:+ start:420 stop:1178 length:759 start_codon:yes stop_codon:yes gene_type:complete
MIYKDLISIVMPLKNGMPFLKETINSIKNQTYNNWELIIVDSESDDGSIEVIKNFDDSRIKILQMKLGPGLARNYGISNSKGSYIAFIDSDDLWKKEKLLMQREDMNYKNSSFSYTNYELISNQSKVLGKNHHFRDEFSYSNFFSKRNIVMSSVMVKKSILENIKLNDYDGFAEDQYFFGKILQNGTKAYGLNEYLLRYRKHSHSRSKDILSNQIAVYKLYRNHFDLGLFKTIISYFSYVIDVALRRVFKTY